MMDAKLRLGTMLQRGARNAELSADDLTLKAEKGSIEGMFRRAHSVIKSTEEKEKIVDAERY
jgi:hypothetical protein